MKYLNGILTASALCAIAAFTMAQSSGPVEIRRGGGSGSSTNTPLLNGTNVFTGTNTFSGIVTLTNITAATNVVSLYGVGGFMVDIDTPTVSLDTGMQLKYLGSTLAGFVMNPSSGLVKIGAFSNGGYYPAFYANNAEAMRITTTGLIGVGTATPASQLQVVGNTTSDGYRTTQQTLGYTTGTNLTVNATNSLHFVSLTNTAYFTAPTSLGVGASFTVHIQQDATGTRAVTFDTNYWKFPGGVVPTITTNALGFDVLSCISCPYGTNVFAIVNQNFR